MSYSPQGSALTDDYPPSGKQVDEGRGGEDPPQRHESRHQNQNQNQQQQRHPAKNNNPDKHNSNRSSQQQQTIPPSVPSSSSRTPPKDDPKARDLSNHQSLNQSSASIQALSHQENLPKDTHQLPSKSSGNTQKKQEHPDPTLSNFPVEDVEGDHLSKTKNQPKLQHAPGETHRKVDQERNSHSLQDHSNGGELSRKPLPVPGTYPLPSPPKLEPLPVPRVSPAPPPPTSPPKLEPLPVLQEYPPPRRPNSPSKLEPRPVQEGYPQPPRSPPSPPKREPLPVPEGYPPPRSPTSPSKLEPRPKKGLLQQICPCCF